MWDGRGLRRLFRLRFFFFLNWPAEGQPRSIRPVRCTNAGAGSAALRLGVPCTAPTNEIIVCVLLPCVVSWFLGFGWALVRRQHSNQSPIAMVGLGRAEKGELVISHYK